MTHWILYCVLLSGDVQLPKACDKVYLSAVECSQAMRAVDPRIGHYCSKKAERCDLEDRDWEGTCPSLGPYADGMDPEIILPFEEWFVQ